MCKFPCALLAAALALPATAGTLADSAWRSARCGPRPLVVGVDLRDPEAYNRSLDKVSAYQRETNTYLDCLLAEGNLDIQLISKAITIEQLAARSAREKLQADIELAEKMFNGK